MVSSLKPTRFTLRGPRIVKTSRGIVSLAAVIGATVLLGPLGAAAQSADPNGCLPGSTGPTAGNPAPYGGGMCDLGTLKADNSGVSYASAVNADGAVVVGEARNDNGSTTAFRWSTDTGAMQDLGTLKADNSGRSSASAVSADGTVVVGEASSNDGSQHAFIWRTQMQDLSNVIGSTPILINDTEIAGTQQQNALDSLMGETCLAGEGQSCMRIGGHLTNTGSTGSQDIAARSSVGATLTYGRGINGRITMGGTLALNGTNLGSNGFDMGNSVNFSLWGEYSENGLVRTGLQAGAAIGWARESGSITRGRGLENVMLATGDADIKTMSARATIGYGFEHRKWLITPSATLAHFRTNRSAYAEQGADFNATYDKLSMERTTVTLGVSGEYHVLEQGTLLLRAGVERDLSADHSVLTGTSTMPGMENFAVSSTLERRNTRGFLDVGYTHDLGRNRTLTANLRVGQAAFGDTLQTGLGISYGMSF